MRYFQKNKKPILLFLAFLCLAFASGIYLRQQKDNADKDIAANPLAAIINSTKSPENPTVNPKPSFSSIASSIPIKEGNSQTVISLKTATNETISSAASATNSPTPSLTASKTPEKGNEQHIVYVGNKEYEISIPEYRTVYDLMISLKQAGDFDFRGKNSSGLGFFVEEINGVKNNARDNLFWIYYINGKKADSGISSYFLKPNDIINWKYEKPQY